MQLNRTREKMNILGTWSARRDRSAGIDNLGDATAGAANDGNSVLRCADRGDAGVQRVLVGTPGKQVHGGNHQGFRLLSNEGVHHSRVTEVITDRDAQCTPGR